MPSSRQHFSRAFQQILKSHRCSAEATVTLVSILWYRLPHLQAVMNAADEPIT